MNQARDLLDRTPEDEQEKMILSLGYYASKVRNEYRWRTQGKDALPKGETVQSVVSLAIEKVLTGDRCWNPEQHPDFLKFMRDVIDSLMNHLACSRDNSLLTPPPEKGSDDEQAWHAGSDRAEPNADWLARKDATPEQALLDKESQEQKDKAILYLFEECAGDQTLTNIVTAMLEGCEQRGEIAQVVGIEVKEVYNAMKRLDRRVVSVSRRMAD